VATTTAQPVEAWRLYNNTHCTQAELRNLAFNAWRENLCASVGWRGHKIVSGRGEGDKEGIKRLERMVFWRS
jgi:hypothetical protein